MQTKEYGKCILTSSKSYNKTHPHNNPPKHDNSNKINYNIYAIRLLLYNTLEHHCNCDKVDASYFSTFSDQPTGLPFVCLQRHDDKL